MQSSVRQGSCPLGQRRATNLRGTCTGGSPLAQGPKEIGSEAPACRETQRTGRARERNRLRPEAIQAGTERGEPSRAGDIAVKGCRKLAARWESGKQRRRRLKARLETGSPSEPCTLSVASVADAVRGEGGKSRSPVEWQAGHSIETQGWSAVRRR